MTTPGKDEQIRIEKWIDQPADPVSRMHLVAGIDAIFWATAARSIADANERGLRSDEPSEAQQAAIRERAAFRELWLGDYLECDPQHVWLALTAANHVAGYLVGTTVDPIASPRFVSLTYFTAFADALGDYPAHLHINLDEAYRNRSIGQRLVDAFAAQITGAGVPGFHVVTSATARNVRFYKRAGFVEVARAPWKAGELVFLGRKT